MLRIFHPIGQGAFYSERHNDFNVVYDCGEWKKSKKSTELVKNSFEPNSIIDILFISHFDYDHISQIETLKNCFNIKNCILPLISDEQKEIIIAFCKCFNWTSAINLIKNPNTFFREETKIIYVDEDVVAEENNEEAIDLKKEKNGNHIKSGQKITISGWLYVPYNKYFKKRHEELKKKLLAHGIVADQFKSDINNCLANKKAIKAVYNRLTCGINANSMFLYSGPAQNNWLRNMPCFSCYEHRRYTWLYICNIKPGCIYTGDADLKDVRLIFKNYWNIIGTIQLPHHGSAKNFDFTFLYKARNNNEHFILPASFGNNNTYGHPAQSVICNIIKNGSCFVPITEQASTTFIQYIEN